MKTISCLSEESIEQEEWDILIHDAQAQECSSHQLAHGVEIAVVDLIGKYSDETVLPAGPLHPTTMTVLHPCSLLSAVVPDNQAWNASLLGLLALTSSSKL